MMHCACPDRVTCAGQARARRGALAATGQPWPGRPPPGGRPGAAAGGRARAGHARLPGPAAARRGHAVRRRRCRAVRGGPPFPRPHIPMSPRLHVPTFPRLRTTAPLQHEQGEQAIVSWQSCMLSWHKGAVLQPPGACPAAGQALSGDTMPTGALLPLPMHLVLPCRSCACLVHVVAAAACLARLPRACAGRRGCQDPGPTPAQVVAHSASPVLRARAGRLRRALDTPGGSA
jgi:hypothetical protein